MKRAACIIAAIIFCSSLDAQFSVDRSDIKKIRWTPTSQEVSGIEENIIDLNGDWKFTVGADVDFYKTQPPHFNDIEVPGEWVMQGFDVEPGKAAGYLRTFTINRNWLPYRVKLKCEAIYSECEIWINQNKVGSHIGGFTPFEFDVTDVIHPGENSIAIVVKSESMADTLSSGSKYAVHALGGITRPIYLMAVPDVNLASFHVNTTFDENYVDSDLHIELTIANESQAHKNISLSFDLTDSDGHRISIENDARLIPIEIPSGDETFNTTFRVSNPLKWDCEHPNLYYLSCKVFSEGKQLQEVKKRFGFRQIEVRGNQVFVNNRVIKLKGVCRHEVDPLRGRSLTGNQWHEDVKLFKEGNVNYIRTSHYPPSEMLLEACDELGMFVEEEAPFCWAKKDYVNDGNYFQAILQPTLEMIERDKSHPSIIQWSLANESFNYFELFKISADFVKEADSSRPRIFSQWNPNSDNGNLELGNHHYPGPEGAIKYKDMERPIVFDEYCHLNAYNRFELLTDPGVRDFWGEDFKTMWEKMFRTRAVLGGALWAGIDDSFFLPSGHVVGYGTWGPIDGWRRKKPEFWHMKKVYSPVKIELLGMEENEPVRLKLDNRYLFTNLEECTIKWQNGNRNGVLQPSCEPGKTIEVNLPLKGAELDTLYIDIYKEGPVPVDQYLFNFSKPNVEWKEEHNLSFKKSNPGKKQVVESDKIRIEFSENGIHITDINGDKILSGFPELMLVPLTGRGGGTQMTKDIPEIELFSPVGKNRRIEDISVKNSDSEIVIHIKDSYDEAIGEMKWVINPDGKTKITYNYRILEELDLRQWGVSFSLSDQFRTLNWKRKGIWSVYPKNHIGRNEGNAILYSGNTNCGLAGPAEKPTWEWKDDQTQYGTNDFRSTKRNIFHATLLNNEGKGVKVSSSGLQHVRAWFANDNIHLLVAEYDNPGAEGYFNSHSNHWNRPLKKGDRITGSINFDMAFTLVFD